MKQKTILFLLCTTFFHSIFSAENSQCTPADKKIQRLKKNITKLSTAHLEKLFILAAESMKTELHLLMQDHLLAFIALNTRHDFERTAQLTDDLWLMLLERQLDEFYVLITNHIKEQIYFLETGTFERTPNPYPPDLPDFEMPAKKWHKLPFAQFLKKPSQPNRKY